MSKDKDFGLGDLIRGLGRLTTTLADAVDEGKATLDKRVSVRSLDGSDLNEALDELRDRLAKRKDARREASAPTSDRIELRLDLLDQGDLLQVIVDEPRIRPSELELSLAGDLLTVRACNEHGQFEGEVLLPWPITPLAAQVKGRNGIITLAWTRDG